MCGIVGSFHPETDADDPWVEGALKQIEHRGPDGRGVLTWMAATHGHVRLAVMDPLPRSDQPFVYGSVLVSFVGEVYNFRRIREALEVEGLPFRTEGDTEVVAAALHRWGVNALELFDGMFALAWTESLSGKTWVARDGMGEIPLYLLEQDGTLFSPGGVRWSSERRVFGRLASEAAAVPPGAVWQLGGGIPSYFWEVERASRARGRVRDPGRVAELISLAVGKRLQADVPVAFLCSGGLDSSLILQEVCQRTTDVVAYVAAMPGYPSADLKHARMLSNRWGFELREVEVPAPELVDLNTTVKTIEIPMKVQVEIAWPCMHLAGAIHRDGFKVVLSGEGADELFGGYGNLARKATDDVAWRKARTESLVKMSRGNCVRTNKVFMRYGVEPRLPFLDRALVEEVLPLGVRGCPPHKVLLKDAARGLVPDWVIDRPKVTFQGGAGVSDAVEILLEGDAVKTYNRMARELFGGVTRG